MEQTFVKKAEKEAQEKAIKQIASMLSRADQLDKVEQYQRRIARKKASVEARLKAAVQSQLDGVKTGLNQMKQALQEVKEIKESMSDVNRMYTSVGTLSVKMRDIKDITSQHSQLATAMENLKNIFEVPDEVEKARAMLKDGKLLLAHKVLTDLENSRDDLLYEQHKLANHSESDVRQLQTYFSEAENLSTELANQLWRVLAKTIQTVRKDPTNITTALRIVEREERTDMKLLQNKEANGFLPPGRPKRWGVKCLEVLKEAVEARVESDVHETREESKMWLVRHLEILRQVIVEDLLVAKFVCRYSFPPSYNIFDKYVIWYHEALSLHLQTLIDENLEGNEIISLLRWLNEYHGSQMMGRVEFRLNCDDLPPLLDEDTRTQLIENYYSTTCENLRSWIDNSLKKDVTDWSDQHKEPDTDQEGYKRTDLPVIFFQMIQQTIEVAKTISKELTKKVVAACVDQMKEFLHKYADAMTSYKEDHFRDRTQPANYYTFMVAIINNCLAFIKYATKFENELQDVMTDEVKVESSNPFGEEEANVQFLLDFKTDMLQFGKVGCDYLLDEVFLDVKEHFDKLLTRGTLSNGECVETFCATLEDYYNDFCSLEPQYLTYLLVEAERRAIVEYLKVILDRRMRCNNDDERGLVAERMNQDRDYLTAWFDRYTSKNCERESCDLLRFVAEVVKLQDKSMMTLELSGLVSKYKDATSEQLQAILAIRGDYSGSESKEVSDEVTAEMKKSSKPIRSVFSSVRSNRRAGFFNRN